MGCSSASSVPDNEKIFGGLVCGGAIFEVALGDINGNIIERKSFETSDPKTTILQVVDYFKDKKIYSLGVASFGPIDPDKKSETFGYITTTPKKGWNNFNIIGVLKKKLNIKNIAFDTDVNAACLGEVLFGSAKDINNSLYLYIGQGIGGVEARNQAEESDRLKSAFLANMSHEIRTPLNAIVGFSDVLSMAQSDDERTELVNLIKQNNVRLLRLFDDMLNMSKLEAGGEAVKKERFDLNQLLMEVADKFADKGKETGIKIEVERLANTVQPFSDRHRLGEILNQYMDNAIKFTNEGVITLGYHVNNGLLRVWVRDTVKGIPASHCNDHLFERFVKIDEFVPGTGLGLSICRSLAISIGGKVGVESKQNVGSLFWVEIPLE